jgi:hypothetical protein
MRNREQQSYHIYFTFLWQVLGLAVPFTSLSKLCQNAHSQDNFVEPKQHV